jgi:3',5'-nucleoside bisphosphate phosphatase
MSAKADLHLHTTASDGMFAPSVVVRMAKEAGLGAIAITDHDTVAGVQEALETGAKLGITVIAGVEISTAANGRDIHVLGYGIQIDDFVFLKRLSSLREIRNSRNAEILKKLAMLGMIVTEEELEDAAGKSPLKDGSIGRPHIAQVLVDKSYVNNMKEAFDLYLGEGKPAFISPPRISPQEAISWIHDAGGRAIIAHPGLYSEDALVLSLLDAGANGLEAFHSDHDTEAEQRYKQWANDRGKLVTGGSDFHGIKDGVSFHGAIGSRTVDAAIVERLMQK